MNDIRRLAKAVEKACLCPATHLRSEDVVERFKGSEIWAGSVEVFELNGHPKAKLCYAWDDHTEGHEGFVTVLGVPKIDTPLKAVQAYIVNMGKNAKRP